MGICIEKLTLRQLKTALEDAERDGYTLFPEAREADGWSNPLAAPRFAGLWEEVHKQGEQYGSSLLTTLPFSEFILFGATGDRQAYEAKYFDRRTRLSVLALLHLTEGGEKWRGALEDTIWAICDEATWVLPAHVGLYVNEYPEGIWDRLLPPRETVDLFSAITAHALAEIISLAGDTLHPWIADRVRKELERRVFQVFFEDPSPQNWEMKTNNWPAVCAAGIGAAAIYEEKNSERLAGMLWRIIAAMRSHLSGFDEEGATSEGIAYWQFGFGFYVYFSELLRERTGGRVDLLEGERTAAIARFPNVCLLSGGKVINFSDAPDEIDFNIGLFGRLQRRFPEVIVPDGQPQPDGQLFRNWANTSRLLLWAEGGASGERAAAGSMAAAAGSGTRKGHSDHGDFYFAGHQWAIAKSRTRDGLVAFAAKGGHNEEPHNHNDLGHFLLHVNGTTVLADLGAGMYTRQYFQRDTRYEMLQAGSHGHSVPIVDGCRQSVGRDYRASVLAYDATPEQVRFTLDLTAAYGCAKLTNLTREFLWDRPVSGGYKLTVRDEALFGEIPRSFVEVFVSAVEPHAVAPGLIRLETVDMTFDGDAYEATIDPQRIQTITGAVKTVYRVLLTARTPEARVVSEVTFVVGTIEK